eukprot:gene17747-24107_t
MPADYPSEIRAPAVGGGAVRPKRKKPAGKPAKTIKDRIKAGAKVHVGERGGLYIVFEGKKHAVKC